MKDSKDVRIENTAKYICNVDRLAFALPSFSRLAWVSESARTVWGSALERLLRAQIDIAIHQIKTGKLAATTVDVNPSELQVLRTAATQQELIVMSLASKFGDGLQALHPGRSRYLLVRCSRSEALLRKAPEDRLVELWDLLGMPSCCRAFEEQIRRPFHLTDDTLARALNTPGVFCEERSVHLDPHALLNPVFELVGFTFFAHAACSFSCVQSSQFCEAWIACGRELGLNEEMDVVMQMSNWPLEWSALHGIAETRTPVFKMTSQTISTAKSYSIQFSGSGVPSEAAIGLRFPYLRPKYLRVTQSASFERGLSNSVQTAPTNAKKQHENIVLGACENVKPKTLASPILNETLKLLKEKVSFNDRFIESIFLSNYFNILRLDDGSTGSCMNYSRFQSNAAVTKSKQELENRLAYDPLLLEHLFSESQSVDFLQLSLRACLISALSAPLVASGIGISVSNRFESTMFKRARRAVVLGFGGYFDYIVRYTQINEIHLSDLSYHVRALRINQRLEHYQQQFPHKTITVSSGFDNKEQLASAELVSITGSALCNGTMEDILAQSQHCQTVIVQGQSASIYPTQLFKRGVSVVSTTLKPSSLINTARTDKKKFRHILEGLSRPHLPTIYLRPLNSGVGTDYYEEDNRI